MYTEIKYKILKPFGAFKGEKVRFLLLVKSQGLVEHSFKKNEILNVLFPIIRPFLISKPNI